MSSFGDDLGERNTASELGAAGDQGGDDKGVETAGRSPADGFRDRSRMGFGRANEIAELCLSCQTGSLGWIDVFHDAQRDGIAGFGIDQDKAAGLAACPRMICRQQAIELYDAVPMSFVRSQSFGGGRFPVSRSMICSGDSLLP